MVSAQVGKWLQAVHSALSGQDIQVKCIVHNVFKTVSAVKDVCFNMNWNVLIWDAR